MSQPNVSKATEDYAFMYETLTDKNVEMQSFETVSSQILNRFQRHEYLSVGALLNMLIRTGDFPKVMQRLHAYYIMFDMFKGEVGVVDSPFLGVLVGVFEPPEAPAKKQQQQFATVKGRQLEQQFVGNLLLHGTKDLAKLTPCQLAQQYLPAMHLDVNSMKELIEERTAAIPRPERSGLPNVVPAPTPMQPLPKVPAEVATRQMMRQLVGDDGPLRNVIAPEFLRLAPPLLPVEDELVWLDFTNPAWHRPAYDASLSNLSIEAKRLVALVFGEPLNIQDRQVLLAELEKDASMVNHIGLTPAKLPSLVENNPLVAIEILMKLMHSSHITEYLYVLVHMDMSLYSMEVVNRLTTSVDLPSEFVYLYISNCISTCETITDIYAQTRLVRLLCVLLQSLIRNKIINIMEMFIELEAFCVEFSRIKEAAGLYRLLKQVELGESTTTATSTTTTTTLTTTGAASPTSATSESAAKTTPSSAGKN